MSDRYALLFASVFPYLQPRYQFCVYSNLNPQHRLSRIRFAVVCVIGNRHLGYDL